MRYKHHFVKTNHEIKKKWRAVEKNNILKKMEKSKNCVKKRKLKR